MPNEVTSPARSLNPVRVRSLGRRRHRTAPHFPAEWEREETRGSEVFPKPGRHSSFLFERRPRFVGEVASEGCPCRDERAGRARDLVRHEAASLRHQDSSLSFRINRARMSSRLAAASNLATPNDRRARRKASSPCMGAARSPPLQRGATPFPSKCGMSPLRVEGMLEPFDGPSRTTITSKRTRQRRSPGGAAGTVRWLRRRAVACRD